ncbi:carbamate kinase [Zhaonella formicivorans]|uniref:carbamate kinase n=1 Tax=Zhaonella formicivorans TaxID=2528593 RepID=UPI001D12708F|nr:carbamate kinase [Zhaonella formicivorans]
MKTVVVALGGNAILQPKQKGTIEEQMANVNASAKNIVKLIQEGYRVVVAHGNGPQVGNILLQNAAAREQVPAMPLDVCGAESQGLIGYMIQQNIRNELKKAGIDKPVVTILTQVVVDRHDPAFQNPTKPVGAFYSKEEAEKNMKEKGETWIEDSGRGWRKVVPSPKPQEVVELEAVRTLVETGAVVIAVGGGGIPVVKEGDKLVGVEAVIDKDLASSLLAKNLGADILAIATDVPYVAINYGKPDQKNLKSMTVAEAKKYLEEGQFGKGSMGPKVQAVLNFVEAGGQGIITSLDTLREAVVGDAGTKVVNS